MLSLVRCVDSSVMSCVDCDFFSKMCGLFSVVRNVDCVVFGRMCGLFSVVSYVYCVVFGKMCGLLSVISYVFFVVVFLKNVRTVSGSELYVLCCLW